MSTSDVEIFGGPLEGWDYATDLHLRRSVVVDCDGVRSDAGLRTDIPIRICVRSRPSSSLIRTLEATVPLAAGGRQSITLDVVVAGRNLAGAVTMETVLELAEDVVEPAPFTAARASSMLWRDEAAASLDGDSGLLPVAPVSFSAAGLPPGAAWYVSLDTARWEWAAMGSLLVLLNTDNPAVNAALEDPTTAGARSLLDTLEVDLVTDLVGRAVEDERFRDSYLAAGDEDSPDDDFSLGSLVRALVRVRLAQPNESVDEALSRLRELRAGDPSYYRAAVQHGLGYPRSEVG
ncbi:hypothetical protein [Kineosporia sp. R_H_3]|uniref:hypothetical protein n=1 Tax=Kineosporia sp. R_H_3 TaxID=1961848 RepID=UPI00117B3EB6|nr:hypothetical protein [Kineosporia sp. R_H_3]